MDKTQIHSQITKELTDLYIRKNADYGDSYAQLREEFGNAYILIHLTEKLNRLKTLLQGNTALVAESVEDSLRDLANYAILELVEIQVENDEAKELIVQNDSDRFPNEYPMETYSKPCSKCAYKLFTSEMEPCCSCGEEKKNFEPSKISNIIV